MLWNGPSADPRTFSSLSNPLRMISVRGNSGSVDCQESFQAIPAGKRGSCSETAYSVVAQPAIP